jgi:hypothetical protein
MISEETKQIVQEYAKRLFDEVWVDYEFLKDKKMKPLEKEQHEAIKAWLLTLLDKNFVPFDVAFPVACCDSCADGETCESDKIKPVESPERELSKDDFDKRQAQNLLLYVRRKNNENE